jgi:septal ring factor EnvC (AmiA/AmiB activator)
MEVAEILPFISLGSTLVAVVVAFMRVKQSSDESKNAITRIEVNIRERIASLEKRIDENDRLTNDVQLKLTRIETQLQNILKNIEDIQVELKENIKQLLSYSGGH